MHRANHRSAFTLIELLVVITIIVVLLALLTPALDKAIYQAELAVCGANQKGIGGALSMYAAENARLYPYRPTVALPGAASAGNGIVWGTAARDDRPYLRNILSVNKALIDPLSEGVDLEGPFEHNDVFYSSYNLWYGWQWYDASTKGQAMRKIGDRFTLPDGTQKFSLLASDWDDFHKGQGWSQSSHPDSAGLAVSIALEREPANHTALWDMGVNAGAGSVFTISFWSANPLRPRGTMDRNFLYDDVSVTRLDRLDFDRTTYEPDDRLTAVPRRTDVNSDPLFVENLPRQGG